MATRDGSKNPWRTAIHGPRTGATPTGHQTVEMRMEAPRLAPRVPRGEDAGHRSEIVLLVESLQQRVAHTGTQERRHHGDVGPPQVRPFTGQGEHDLVMLTGQQPRLLASPASARSGSQDMADTTGGDRSCTTPVQHAPRDRLDVAPQHRRATDQQRPHRFPHIARQRVAAFECRVALLAKSAGP